MSKDKVLSVLTQRINQADNESRKQEKDYLRNGGNLKSFLESYMKEKREFHKYNILKVKVS